MSSESDRSFHDRPVQQALRTWWESLKENRGDRAALRRCRDIDAVLLTEAYHKLRKRLAGVGFTPRSEAQLGAVAGLLAHVDENAPNQPKVAAQMAGGAQDEEARVHGLRFRRLLQEETRDELYRTLMRVIRLLDRRVHVSSLAKDVYYWGPSVRKTWARDYYDLALEEV